MESRSDVLKRKREMLAGQEAHEKEKRARAAVAASRAMQAQVPYLVIRPGRVEVNPPWIKRAFSTSGGAERLIKSLSWTGGDLHQWADFSDLMARVNAGAAGIAAMARYEVVDLWHPDEIDRAARMLLALNMPGPRSGSAAAGGLEGYFDAVQSGAFGVARSFWEGKTSESLSIGEPCRWWVIGPKLVPVNTWQETLPIQVCVDHTTGGIVFIRKLGLVPGERAEVERRELLRLAASLRSQADRLASMGGESESLADLLRREADHYADEAADEALMRRRARQALGLDASEPAPEPDEAA